MHPGFPCSIRVTAVRAVQLDNVQKIGRQTPVCVVRVGHESHKSKPHLRGGLEPKWNATMEFHKVAAPSAFVEVEVRNVIIPQSLGKAKFTLSDVLNKTPATEGWFPLYRKKHTAGYVLLRLERIGLADVCPPTMTDDRVSFTIDSTPQEDCEYEQYFV